MAEQAISELKNLPRGSVESVPVRMTGKEEGHPRSPTDDAYTEGRRAPYGEDPAFKTPSGERKEVDDSNVNDVKTKRNKTMLEQIRGGYEDTSFGRSMSQ